VSLLFGTTNITNVVNHAAELNNLPDARRVPCLQIALLSRYATRIADFDQTTRQDYNLTKAALLKVDHVSPFSMLKEFQNATKTKTESYYSYAIRLRYYYIHYAAIDLNQLNTPAVTQLLSLMILPKVFESVPVQVQPATRHYATTHTFEETLQEIDNQVAAFEASRPMTPRYPGSTSGQRARFPNSTTTFRLVPTQSEPSQLETRGRF
jgi:hypothetical protein